MPDSFPMTFLASRRALFAGILFFGLLAMTARSATDPDLWWHLRTGQLIVESHHVPRTDPFSFTRGGSPWISHEWLSEVVFYELWSHAGPGGLIIFSSVILTAGFLLLYVRCPGKPHWAAILTALGAAAAASSWGARPQIFTFALASLLLWLLFRSEQRPRLLLWIPPLFLLWLNLHGGFALGPALLLLYTIGLMLESAAGTIPWSESWPLILRVLGVGFICLALVPLNPSGTELYRYPLDTLRSTGMRTFIVEWQSPNFHQWIYLPFFFVILLLVIALAYSRARVPGRTLLPLLFTALAALDAVRHIPIFILLAIPVIAIAIPASSSSAILNPRRQVPQRTQTAFNAAALVLLALFAVLRWTELARDQRAREAALFPQKAVAFLAATHEPDRLFAYYDWGGYVIWKLDSHYRVFADGRADLYGDDLLRQCVKTVAQLHRGWEQVLDDWGVGTILVPPSSALAQALFLDPRWISAHRDAQAVIFIRAPNRPSRAITSDNRR
ncbi:MAG: hypothetical protein WA609_15385 [Terriglobales bacterium]